LDLGLHGAFGYQGASFSKHFFLFFSLGYHGALSQIFLSHGGIQAKTEPFSRTFLSLNGAQAITEPFLQTFLSLNGTQAITEPFSRTFSFSRWNSGYNGAFSWNHSFTLGFRLSRSLLMESFFHFGISAITEPSHGIILSLWDFGYHRAFSWNHSFTLGFRLSRSLLNGIILSLLDLINMDSHKHT
jgi:hypothetical protein